MGDDQSKTTLGGYEALVEIIRLGKRVCSCHHESYFHRLNGSCSLCPCVDLSMAWMGSPKSEPRKEVI